MHYLPITKKRIATTFLCLFVGLWAMAQNHDRIWIFGTNGGYDWNTNTAITNSAINTFEGCASISDASGNLLMYTDGITVWDGNNAQVFTGMTGNASSTQSGVIVPRPGSDDYYIISVDFMGTGNGYNSRMAWYQADMVSGSLNSVGPAAGNTMISNSSEKIAAYRKPCDPDTIWIVGHNWTLGRYEVFAATNSGIASTGETTLDLFNVANTRSKLGALRFSHDGSVLASAVFDQHVELLGFDPNTGTFTGSNAIFNTDPPNNGASINLVEVYGLEFSPDDTQLYLSITGSGSVDDNSLWQYNVSSMVQATIESSRQSLYSAGTAANRLEPNQIQLAPDGNLYVAMRREGNPVTVPANSSFLGRISNPNVGGAANFNPTAIAGPATWVRRGLPTFLTEVQADTMETIALCVGESVELQSPIGSSGHNWTPNTDLSCTTCANPTASPLESITYSASFFDASGVCAVVEYPIDVVVCDPCDTLDLTAAFSHTSSSLTVNVQDLSTANGSDPVSYVEWNFGDGSGWIPAQAGASLSHTFPESGTYEICLHASYFVGENICCHDTICEMVEVVFDTCEGFTANFLSGQVPGTTDVIFEDVTSPASGISIWTFGDGTGQLTTGTGAGPFTHSYPGPGTYVVTLIAIDHYQDTLCCVDTLIRRVNVIEPRAFRVSPTVTDGELEIAVLIHHPEEYQIRILNSEGQAVRQQQVMENGLLQMNIQSLVQGVYFVELTGNGARHVQKVIKY